MRLQWAPSFHTWFQRHREAKPEPPFRRDFAPNSPSLGGGNLRLASPAVHETIHVWIDRVQLDHKRTSVLELIGEYHILGITNGLMNHPKRYDQYNTSNQKLGVLLSLPAGRSPFVQ